MTPDDQKKITDEKDKQAKTQQTINADQQRGIDLQKVATDLAARLTGEARSYSTELKEILGIKSKLNEDDKALLSISRKLIASAQENNTLLRRSGGLASRILKDEKDLAEVKREINILLATNREIAGQIYNDAVELQTVQNRLLEIDKEIAAVNLKKEGNYKKTLENLYNQQANLEEQRSELEKTTNVEAKKLAVLLANQRISSEILEVRKEELKFGHEVNKNLGITGALLDNLDKIGVRILGGIGLNFGVFAEAIKEGKERMHEVAEAYTLLNQKQKELSLLDPIKNKNQVEELRNQLTLIGLDIAKTFGGNVSKKYNDFVQTGINLLEQQKQKQAELNALNAKKSASDDELKQITQIKNELGNLEGLIKANNDQMDKFGLEIADANKGLSGMTIKYRAMKQALPGIRKAFTEALLDPLTPALIGLKLAGGLINLMKENFGALDKATVEFRRLTGQNASVLAGMNNRLATSVQTLGIMAALTKEIGTDASAIFGPQELGALAEAQNLLGLSAEQTSMLGLMAKSTGKSIDGFQDSFSAATAQANALGDSAIPVGLVFGDILTVSKDISLSLGNNPQALAKAGVAARALGLDLKKIDQIASSILDFESSIEAELEAQLLTGKAINLAKAREFALNNDLAGVANELAKNGASAAEYANMNRLQQESLAKSLGMSREELANMIIAQDTQNQLTEDQRAKIRGVTLAQSKQMEVQEEIRMSLQKLAQAFLPIVQAVTPLITALTPLVTYLAEAVAYGLNMANIFSDAKEKTTELTGAAKALGITLVGIAGLFVGGKIFGWVRSAIAGIKSLSATAAAAGGPLKALGASVSNAFTRVGTAAATASGTAAATTVTTAGTAAATAGATAPQMTAASTASKATSITARAAKTAQTIPLTAGKGVRKFLTDLSRGLMAMGLPGVPVGTAALSASTPAIRAAVMNTRTITPASAGKVKVFLTSLSQGLTRMVKAGPGVKVLAGAALAFTLMTAAIPAMAFIGAFGPAVGAGLKAISTGLTALGKVGPAAVKGMLILGGIGIALAPLTYALSLLAPLVKEVFTGFSNLLEGLTMEKLVGLFALGPALMVAAAGLTAFGAAMTFGGLGAGITNLLTGGGLLGQLGTLAEMAQPLARVGASLMAISAGLQAVADATEKIEVEKIKELDGLITTTAQAAPYIVTTKAIGDIIGNIAGRQETTTSPSNDRVINKLDELISIVRKGGNVYIDGNKVGQATVLAYTKQG